MARIHDTAVLAKGAEIADGAEIGPYSIIGPHVRIGRGTVVGPHAVIDGHTEIGEGNRIFPFASVGGEPQDLKYRGEPTRLVVGNRNTIREYVTVNVGTVQGGGVTVIGNGNLFLAGAHVAHDCRIGDGTVLVNGTALGGHVTVEDFATLGGYSAVHQFVRVGKHAYVGGGSMVVLDIPPFVKANGDRARLYGINTIGLKRRGFADGAIKAIRQAYRIVFQSGALLEDALRRAEAEWGHVPEAAYFVAFIRGTQRGVCR